MKHGRATMSLKGTRKSFEIKIGMFSCLLFISKHFAISPHLIVHAELI